MNEQGKNILEWQLIGLLGAAEIIGFLLARADGMFWCIVFLGAGIWFGRQLRNHKHSQDLDMIQEQVERLDATAKSFLKHIPSQDIDDGGAS